MHNSYIVKVIKAFFLETCTNVSISIHITCLGAKRVQIKVQKCGKCLTQYKIPAITNCVRYHGTCIKVGTLLTRFPPSQGDTRGRRANSIMSIRHKIKCHNGRSQYFYISCKYIVTL